MSAESSIVFERAYGVRHTRTHGGETVTSVSQPDWPTFLHAIGRVASNGEAGTLVSTPEFMTSANIGLAAISQHQALIEDRVSEISELSRQIPDSTLLLGSAVFDPVAEKPRNAVVFLQNGAEVGRTHKVTSLTGLELIHLHTASATAGVTKPRHNVLNVICSDLLFPPLIDTAVETLLVSGCWGTPAGYPANVASPDHRHVALLERTVQGIFDQQSDLHTIIMTDRLPVASPLAGLFNFVARR